MINKFYAHYVSHKLFLPLISFALCTLNCVLHGASQLAAERFIRWMMLWHDASWEYNRCVPYGTYMFDAFLTFVLMYCALVFLIFLCLPRILHSFVFASSHFLKITGHCTNVPFFRKIFSMRCIRESLTIERKIKPSEKTYFTVHLEFFFVWT